MKKWLFLGIVLVFGCEDNSNCGISDFSEDVVIRFMNIETKAARTVTFDEMRVAYSNRDVIAYVDDDEGTIYSFPVDLAAESTSFEFLTDSVNYDFTLTYRRDVFIENPDCGPINRIFNLDGTSIEFDSIAFQVPELTKFVSPHVEIYF